MKILSRDFTIKERALIIALFAILVGLFYYRFVDQPVRTALTTCDAEKQSLQTELDVVTAQITHLENMQNELDDVKNGRTVGMMASYNNSKEELRMLNEILSPTERYSITFSDITRDGDQIRRAFSLSFTVSSYEEMKDILAELAYCPYRCLIGNISCSMAREDDLLSDCQVSCTATFYETMVGGTPDSGLPADSKEASADVNYSVDSAIAGTAAADDVQNVTNNGF